MTPIGKQRATPRASGGSEFTQAMKFELLGEDDRPLLSSYGISLTLGALWLSLVYFGPKTTPASDGWRKIVEPPIGDVRLVPWPVPEPPVISAPPLVRIVPGGSGGHSTRAPRTPGEAIGTAFQNGGTKALAAAKQLGAALAGATLSTAGEGGVLRNTAAGGTGKIALGGAVGAAGGPGRSGAFAGGEGGTTGVGTVGTGGRGAGVEGVAVIVRDPIVVTKPEIPGNTRDVADVGQVVRSYSAQLQSCYEREGLKQNPGLAGTLTAAITISGAGRVTGVDVTRRTWSGPGADDAERCIVSTIRRWRFAPSSEPEGTYTFPFSFTK